MLKEADQQMETRAWIAITLVLLAGCSKPTVNISSGSTELLSALAAPVPSPTQTPRPTTSSPRTLKLKLTLDTPADLKVALGQTLVKGQILSDRSSARDRLTTQRQVLLLKLEQLKQPQTSPSDTPPSPEVSYAEEHAKIRIAKLEIDRAKAAIDAFIAASPWTDYAREQFNQRKEKEKLAELNNVLAQKQAALELATAQLQTSIESHRSKTNTPTNIQTQQDNSLEQAQILTQLSSIESELTRLGVVRSPYAGTVKKIKWVGQSDQQLLAELTIAVAEKDTNTSTPATPKKHLPAKLTDNTHKATHNSEDTSESKSPAKGLAKGFEPTWQVLSVHDGDTMRVRQGNQIERVRFSCIDAPEISQPQGLASRDNLRSLIAQAGDRVSLKIIDTDRYGRRIAEVFAGGKLLQSEQTSSGMAYVYERYLNNCPSATKVKQAEALARTEHLGVWSGSHEKPWEYRKRNR
jgi:endonuclease YncB( thermonuclease family)